MSRGNFEKISPKELIRPWFISDWKLFDFRLEINRLYFVYSRFPYALYWLKNRTSTPLFPLGNNGVPAKFFMGVGCFSATLPQGTLMRQGNNRPVHRLS
jgi:hypothetical protein